MQAAAIFCVLVLVVSYADRIVHVQGRRHHGHGGCHPFSCGHLHNISYPFRRRGDPRRCGVSSYELDCSSSGKPTIRINTGTYYVNSINYTASSFWVVDANLQEDTNSSSCPLPRPDQFPWGIPGSHDTTDLAPDVAVMWASFVNCSQELTNTSSSTIVTRASFVNCSQKLTNTISSIYMPVDCLSTGSSFVYVSMDYCYDSYDFGAPQSIRQLEPSCGYLAMIPFGGQGMASRHSTYADLVHLMRRGFAVRFPIDGGLSINWFGLIEKCLNESICLFGSLDQSLPSTGIKVRIVDIVTTDFRFWACTIGVNRRYHFSLPLIIRAMIRYDKSLYYQLFILSILTLVKWIAVLCRFVVAPLAVMIFLTHKYWKTRIAIDAVEKFLRMQLMLGPKRYAYTDIIAVTAHFRDKLGQGGYGSVYKGVLLPGNVHVAVKMLTNGNSSCNGEDFISEVATIGRIHHVNVVRLVGFCSEEMRRALVYEYMPRGSLDKYIFSPEKSFSWDKLNEIALGIARGINYLHQGCDMQILHFDIKPHNILLDNNFVPKVADFGLAKLYPRDKSFVSDRALRGTVGYMAPELASRCFGVISNKSDVYSFGMMLLEMAGGRRNADPNADSDASQAYYPSWVYDQLLIERHDQQVQAAEISAAAGGGAAAAEMHKVERKLCLVGLWCIQMRSRDRPTMSEAIEMLEGDVDALQVPPRPFFCDGVVVGDSMPPPVMDSYLHCSSELTTISEEDSAIVAADELASTSS